MPLPTTYEEALLLEPFLAQQPVDESPRAYFDLPPEFPTTNYFGRLGRGRSGGDPLTAMTKMEELRMRRAADLQAQEMMKVWDQVDPTAPTYPQARQQILMRFPLATQSDVGKTVLGAGDFTFQQSRQADPNRSFLQRAAYDGVTPDEIAALTDPATGQVDTFALGNLAGERRRQAQLAARRPERDTTLRDLATEYETLNLIRDPKMRPQVEARKQQISQQILGLTAAPVPGIPATAPATPTAPVPAASDFQAIYDALPKGARYTDPNGISRIKQ